MYRYVKLKRYLPGSISFGIISCVALLYSGNSLKRVLFILLILQPTVQECDATNVEKWFWSQAKNYFYLYNSLLFKPKHFKKRTIYFKTL